MNQATDYNGWRNRTTWNIALWLGNDYGLYQAAREYAQERKGTKRITGRMARNLCLCLIGNQTPDGCNVRAKCVDWKAVAECIEEMAA